MQRNRREFLENVGSGMLIAGLGSSLAGDLGVRSRQGLRKDEHGHRAPGYEQACSLLGVDA